MKGTYEIHIAWATMNGLWMILSHTTEYSRILLLTTKQNIYKNFDLMDLILTIKPVLGDVDVQ